MNKFQLRRWLPYVVALACFIVITGIYFVPQYEGRTLRQHDVVQYEGMSRDIVEHRAAYGEDPQWTGNMFGGMPAYLINMGYDSLIIQRASKILYFMGQPAALIFIAMAAFFVMLLLIGINPWVAIAPSLAYGFSTYFFIIIGAGHITKMVALAFAPLVLGAVFYAYRRNMWLGAALTALFGSIQIAANHPQITYYFLMIVAAFWINELIQVVRRHALPRFAKTTGLLLLAGVLAVGSNAAPLWYVQQHTPETIRGGSELREGTSESDAGGLDLDYATAWSYGRTESFNLFIPNLMGGSSDRGFAEDGAVADALAPYNARNLAAQLPAYWGDQPVTSGPTYLGAVAIFLCVLGLFLLEGRSKWWVLVITVLALLLSWGRNLMWLTELFFNYFPAYNKFRTVSMILVIAEWSVPFLAALVVNALWRQQNAGSTPGANSVGNGFGAISRERFLRGMKYATGITGGVALLFWILGGTVMSFTAPFDAQLAGQLPDDVLTAMRTERAAMMRADALRSLVFVLLTAGVVWLFYAGKIKKWMFATGLVFLVTVDMLPVNARFLPQSKFVEERKTQMQPTAADQQIMADSTLGFRVFNTTVSPFNDATTSYYHRSVGGYHGAKLQRYQDVIERHLSQMHMGVFNMLNTRYFIVQDKTSGQPVAQLNPEANGAAWFVDRVDWVDGADAEIGALDTLDTRRVAVVDRRFADQLDGVQWVADSSAQIALTEYRANRLTYTYTAAAPGVAVFSEIYYPHGWSATIDGQPADYFRADYILRAMVLPAGTHTVVFSFRAPDFALLSGITLWSSVVILILVVVAAVWSIIYNRKVKRKDGSTVE